MKKILYVLVATSVCGCLLTQSDPAPPVKRPFLEGKVVVEHVTVPNQGEITALNAGFRIRPADKGTAPKPVGVHLATEEGRFRAANELLRTDPGRAPECQKLKISKKPSASTEKPVAPAEPGWLDIGKIGFGPALQPNLTFLELTSQKRYQTVFRLGLPPGAYQLLNDGTPDTPPLREVLSMPEEVFSLRLNGKDFGDPFVAFQPAKDLALSWREPAPPPNERNGIMMEIVVEDADYLYGVFCAKYESEIPVTANRKQWSLDEAWFAEFPRTGDGEFTFIRTHLIDSVGENSEIFHQGSRRLFSRLSAHP